MFLIGAAVYIVPAVVFMVLGSASVQPWNELAAVATEESDEAADCEAAESTEKKNRL